MSDFVQPIRYTYIHLRCKSVTKISTKVAENFARDPKHYGAMYCAACKEHCRVDHFIWEDTGQPVGSAAPPEVPAIQTRRNGTAPVADSDLVSDFRAELVRYAEWLAKLADDEDIAKRGSEVWAAITEISEWMESVVAEANPETPVNERPPYDLTCGLCHNPLIVNQSHSCERMTPGSYVLVTRPT